MTSGVALAILLLVVLMLRRNRASKIEEGDIEELVEQELDAAAAEIDEEDAVEVEAATEFQDYDSTDLDNELDEIIGLSDDDDGTDEVEEKQELEESQEQLDVLSIVEQLVSEQQYRRGLSMLNTSLQEQGENEAVRAKIEEIESLLEAEDAKQQIDDEMAEAQEVEDRESETKSFLDDLGIDLDSIDYEDDNDEAVAESQPEEAAEVEEPVADSTDSEDVDLMFDLGGGEDDQDDEIDDGSSAAEEEGSAAETFEFDIDDGAGTLETEQEEPEAVDIDTLEFDADAAEEVRADVTTDDEEVDLETFSFDADAAANLTQAAEVEQDAVEEEGPNAVEFSFDKADLEDSTETSEPASNDEVETFDFDLDEEAGDTVLEKPAADGDVAAGDTVEDFDFDLDEFEIDPSTADATPAAVTEVTSDTLDEDLFDLDAEVDKQDSVAATENDTNENLSTDDDAEIEFDIDDEPADVIVDSAESSEDELLEEDNLDFLSDNEIEIESVDDIEEVDMLSDADETATKLELAYAYQKMGDADGAKEILQEVIREGSDEQIAEATKLLGTIGD